MRLPIVAALLLPGILAAAPSSIPAAPAPAAEDAATLRGQVIDPVFMEKSRVKAALALVRIDAEMLGSALLELGEKQKNAVNLPFLVAYTTQEEARHLRLMATWASWASAPDKAAAAFLEKSGAEDEKESCRAIEAAGFIAALTKDRTTWPKFIEIARGEREQAGIEAARALNRTMDRRAQKEVVEAACATGNKHVRKHLVWAVLDFEGGEKPVQKIFESMRAKPGDIGKNASDCAEIVALDKQANAFEWRPDALKEVPAWWKTGRPKDLKPEIAVKDDATKAKVEGWLDEMKKEVPGWEHYARSVLHRVAYRVDKDFEIYNLKKKTLFLENSVIARCESAWQGEYVLAQATGVAFSAQFGEPSRDHRGWEPSYVDLHSFMKSTKHQPPKFREYIDENLAKKAWP